MRSKGCLRQLRVLQGLFVGLSVLSVLGLMAMAQVQAQLVVGQVPIPLGNEPIVNPGLVNSGPQKPTPPGFWCQVIMANSKWVVLQDEEGRQYPLSSQAIGQFLVRWPSNLASIGAQSMLEVSGNDLNPNAMSTDHIDIFESDAYSLVSTPFVMSNYGFTPFVNPASFAVQNVLSGLNMITNPVVIGELTLPSVRTVVGRAESVSPLRISIGSNNSVLIQPMNDAGISMTRVTLGNTGIAAPGDVVFISATAMNTKSLAATQVVLYKRISYAQALLGNKR